MPRLRRAAVVVGASVVVAAAALGVQACGGGSGSVPDAKHAASAAPGLGLVRPPQPHRGPPARPTGDRLAHFRARVRRACGPVPAVVRAASGHHSAVELRQEAARLGALRRRLAALRALGPARERAILRAYRSRLAAQILLDERIATAIDDGDSASERVGTGQNQYNSDKRTRLAADLRITCLAAAKV